MSSKTTSDSPLANVAMGIEGRRHDLVDRHRHLRNKVATIERSIPALMAYNMWLAADSQDCRDAPYRKVREIINELSPQPDPVDRLLVELKSTVHDLQQETAQLHDKIIDADVKLEETAMELESLELSNKEMEEKLAGLRDEVRKHSTPSLHSIHSEDLLCLRKIRQLAEEEFKLKNCIKELKNKEGIYRKQMRQMLSCKKLQRTNVKKTCCSCPMSTKLIVRERISKKSCRLNTREELSTPLSCCVPLNNRATTRHKSHGCRISCAPCRLIPTAFKTDSPLDDVFSKIDVNVSRSLKQLAHSTVPCELDKTCNDCETSDICKQADSCRCTCEGKCTRVLLNAPCNYSNVTPLAPDKTISSPGVGDSNSDEEFCECCSCGCEGSENSS